MRPWTMWESEALAGFRCGECHADMDRGRSGWLECPNGHGKMSCEMEPGENDRLNWEMLDTTVD